MDFKIYLVIIVLVSLFVFFAKFVKLWLKLFVIIIKLPGPPALPFIGNAMYITNNEKLIELGSNAYEKYGCIIRCWLSFIPTVFIFEPKYIQIILGSSKHTDKSFLYSFMHTFIGEGLITNSGVKWKKNRKLIQPYFHVNVLRKYINIFYESALKAVEELKPNETLNITNLVNEYILEVLQSCVLGISKLDIKTHEKLQNSPFRKGKVSLAYRLTRPWFLLDFLYKNTWFAKLELQQKKNLQNYVKEILNMKRQNKLSGSTGLSLMDMFMEISDSNSTFTEDDVVKEICTFMLAGQDSAGAASTFCLYYLAKHKNHQKCVFKELETITNNSLLNCNVLNKMKYLEQCIKETLRLCPSVPIIGRTLTEDVIIGGINFPKGTNVFLSPFVTHRLKHIYNDPENFDPDRFSQENEEKLLPFSYMPFSAGPRNCIGYKFAMLEMKILLATILRKFDISLDTNHEMRLSYRVTLRASGGVWLNLRHRKNELKENYC